MEEQNNKIFNITVNPSHIVDPIDSAIWIYYFKIMIKGNEKLGKILYEEHDQNEPFTMFFEKVKKLNVDEENRTGFTHVIYGQIDHPAIFAEEAVKTKLEKILLNITQKESTKE